MNVYLREISGTYRWLSAPQTHLFSVVAHHEAGQSEQDEHALRGPAAANRCIILQENNLPQLLTSIHKSQFMHGVSPRDFVTFLHTCTAIYKVAPNAMEGIFYQVKTLLPKDKWPDALDWHEISAGSSERGIFTFLKERMSFISNVSLC